VTPTPTRSTIVLAAIQREIADRRLSIDGSTDIAEITVTVKLQAGTTWIRGTQYCEERIVRARTQRAP
jgi:hypothetical protein